MKGREVIDTIEKNLVFFVNNYIEINKVASIFEDIVNLIINDLIPQEKFKDLQAIKFIQSSAEDIDLSLNSVDKIICTNSFHHYTDPTVVLASIKKILKTNGIFCIADLTKDSLRF